MNLNVYTARGSHSAGGILKQGRVSEFMGLQCQDTRKDPETGRRDLEKGRKWRNAKKEDEDNK